MSSEEMGINLQRKRESRWQVRWCWRVGHELAKRRGEQKEVLPADSDSELLLLLLLMVSILDLW